MGSVRSHTAAHGVEWNVKDSVSTDSELQEALQTSCVDDDHKEWVEGAIAQHLERVCCRLQGWTEHLLGVGTVVPPHWP